ncbi:hypothetical protein EPI10_002175 [Gossypium australe]|uniref:Uncharacterized protein n=1 Tax=Gossypium australe TaxID=47621 RepID=A0A5B6VDS3_9ROSI|nr:hypothetical protein EPI10_002175 [Gossypium australe]
MPCEAASNDQDGNDPNYPKHLAALREFNEGSKPALKPIPLIYNRVTDDVVRLCLFPFSLCDHTTDWLVSLESVDLFNFVIRSPTSSNLKAKTYIKLGIDLSYC